MYLCKCFYSYSIACLDFFIQICYLNRNLSDEIVWLMILPLEHFTQIRQKILLEFEKRIPNLLTDRPAEVGRRRGVP